jgi:DNA polymerase III subunit delta'
MTLSAWTRFPWQEALWNRLRPDRGSDHHAILLSGPEGIGKQGLARALAAALLCMQPNSDASACGKCESCHWLHAGNHPDFRWLTTPARLQEDAAEEESESVDAEDRTPEKKASEQIGIDAIRSLASFFSLSSHRGGVRIVLIEPADALNSAAANALLKTLEEPSAGTRFILVSNHARRLPATILSRCLNVSVPLPSADHAALWLKEQGVTSPEALLKQAAGRPLTALILADPKQQQARHEFIAQLSKLGGDPFGLSEKANRENVALWTEWLQCWCYDLLAYKHQVPIRFHPEFEARLKALSSQIEMGRLLDLEKKLRLARYQSLQPVNPRLFCDDLLNAYCAVLQ